MLILLAASAALCWQTMLGGLAGLINMRRGNTADTMPAMAAVASILQCIMFLAKPEWYNPATLCLMTGPASAAAVRQRCRQGNRRPHHPG